MQIVVGFDSREESSRHVLIPIPEVPRFPSTHLGKGGDGIVTDGVE